MKILVCGGRDYTDFIRVENELNSWLYHVGIKCIIHGGAVGADALGKKFATKYQVREWEFTADWKNLGAPGAVVREGTYGPYNIKAGFDRNQKMIDVGEPDVVIAFGGARGTRDMITRAKDSLIDVIEIDR